MHKMATLDTLACAFSFVVIIDGWPETKQPPGGPSKTWTSRSGEILAVKLIIAEMEFSSGMSFAGTITRKQENYRTLILAALRNAG